MAAGSAETVCALFQQSFTTRLKACDYSVGEFRCAKITTKVTGDRDPGYGSTAKMLAESATTLLATDRDETTGTPGGFWTPATAMGDRLIESLVEHAGLNFEAVGE